MQLHARLPTWRGDAQVLRVATQAAAASPRAAFLGEGTPPGFGVYLRRASSVPDAGAVHLPDALDYLAEGDILRLVPSAGEVSVLYRRASAHNSILLTERCNSRCLMCSQPPRTADDSFLVEVWQRAIPLMDPETKELGISGGEPTLLGDGLLDILRACRAHLPKTALHLLSNGRLFNYLSLARAVADIGCADLMVGVPLYSDIASRHDYVVQAAGAFDQTIRGITNLKRCGIAVELRVVLHRETVARLTAFARFIARNLPFVDHVALMGLELMGFAKTNLEALWVEPREYQSELREATHLLAQGGLNVSIYNHQWCVLDPSLWRFARRSISDWKNEHLPLCEGCVVRDECGGFFVSSRLRYSRHIRPLQAGDVPSAKPPVAEGAP